MTRRLSALVLVGLVVFGVSEPKGKLAEVLVVTEEATIGEKVALVDATSV